MVEVFLCKVEIYYKYRAKLAPKQTRRDVSKKIRNSNIEIRNKL